MTHINIQRVIKEDEISLKYANNEQKQFSDLDTFALDCAVSTVSAVSRTKIGTSLQRMKIASVLNDNSINQDEIIFSLKRTVHCSKKACVSDSKNRRDTEIASNSFASTACNVTDIAENDEIKVSHSETTAQRVTQPNASEGKSVTLQNLQQVGLQPSPKHQSPPAATKFQRPRKYLSNDTLGFMRDILLQSQIEFEQDVFSTIRLKAENDSPKLKQTNDPSMSPKRAAKPIKKEGHEHQSRVHVSFSGVRAQEKLIRYLYREVEQAALLEQEGRGSDDERFCQTLIELQESVRTLSPVNSKNFVRLASPATENSRINRDLSIQRSNSLSTKAFFATPQKSISSIPEPSDYISDNDDQRNMRPNNPNTVVDPFGSSLKPGCTPTSSPIHSFDLIKPYSQYPQTTSHVYFSSDDSSTDVLTPPSTPCRSLLASLSVSRFARMVGSSPQVFKMHREGTKLMRSPPISIIQMDEMSNVTSKGSNYSSMKKQVPQTGEKKKKSFPSIIGKISKKCFKR